MQLVSRADGDKSTYHTWNSICYAMNCLITSIHFLIQNLLLISITNLLKAV